MGVSGDHGMKGIRDATPLLNFPCKSREPLPEKPWSIHHSSGLPQVAVLLSAKHYFRLQSICARLCPVQIVCGAKICAHTNSGLDSSKIHTSRNISNTISTNSFLQKGPTRGSLRRRRCLHCNLLSRSPALPEPHKEMFLSSPVVEPKLPFRVQQRNLK